MGAYDGATFDRTIVDSVENSGSPIHVQQVFVCLSGCSQLFHKVQDLMIDRDNAPTFRLRVYTPEKPGKLPVLVCIHNVTLLY